MGISRLTAMIIQSRDDVECAAGGPTKDTGKYAGWITLGAEDRFRPLLNSEAVYATAEEAKLAMEAVIAEIRGRPIE